MSSWKELKWYVQCKVRLIWKQGFNSWLASCKSVLNNLALFHTYWQNNWKAVQTDSLKGGPPIFQQRHNMTPTWSLLHPHLTKRLAQEARQQGNNIRKGWIHHSTQPFFPSFPTSFAVFLLHCLPESAEPPAVAGKHLPWVKFIPEGRKISQGRIINTCVLIEPGKLY